jgi:hypothetical protein
MAETFPAPRERERPGKTHLRNHWRDTRIFRGRMVIFFQVVRAVKKYFVFVIRLLSMSLAVETSQFVGEQPLNPRSRLQR